MLLKERTQTMNNKIKLQSLGLHVDELGSWLTAEKVFQGQRSRGTHV